jgi:hypothetical protein
VIKIGTMIYHESRYWKTDNLSGDEVPGWNARYLPYVVVNITDSRIYATGAGVDMKRPARPSTNTGLRTGRLWRPRRSVRIWRRSTSSATQGRRAERGTMIDKLYTLVGRYTPGWLTQFVVQYPRLSFIVFVAIGAAAGVSVVFVVRWALGRFFV